MPKQHVVAQGECLSLIARRHGFADWKTIYDHPDNAALKKARPNPNLLFPGDVVTIPDLTPKVLALATGKKHRIVIKRPRKVLRLMICGRDGSALSGLAYTLAFGDGLLRQGKSTDGKGKLEEPVPDGVTAAILTIDGQTLQLRFGHLNPLAQTRDEGLSGVQSRLINLGYRAGNAEGVPTAQTRIALELFQHDQQIQVTGQPDAATVDKLKNQHGC